MRTITGDAPNSIENQSVIDIMYRAWFFILSIGILLPLRWLPHVLPKPSKMTFPVVATAALISCGELMLANPTISPAGPYCPGNMVTISFTGTNLPDGENIEVFIDDISTYNPFLGGGSSIGTIPIDYSCTTCPTIMAVMLNPATCSGSYPNDEQNEFMVLGSGCGFNVANFQLNPSVGGGGLNDSIGGSQGCQWSLANATAAANFLTTNGTGCAGNIFPAGPTTQIPGGAIVITFSDAFGPNVPFNFQSLCATGMPIYILSSSCDRLMNMGAYSNTVASSPGYTLTTCSPPTTQFSYNAPPAPGSSAINNVVALGGASFVSTGDCTDPGVSTLNFPDIPISTATLNYTIPAGICGSGAGLVDFYVSGMIDLAAPCDEVLYTPPSASVLMVACLSVTVDTFISSTSCDSDSSGSIVVNIETIGGTAPYDTDWDNADPGNYPYPEDGNTFFGVGASIGLNGVPAGTYTLVITDALGCADTLTFVVDISDPPIATIQIPPPILCNGGTTDILITSIDPFPIFPIIIDWDNIDIPGNEDLDLNGIDDDDGVNAGDIFDVPAGTYVLTITVSDGFQFSCEFLDTVIITEPLLFSVTPVDGSVSCYGGSNGSVSANPSGGTSPYTYDWFTISGIDTQTETGLAAGTYTFSVSDANGCPSGLLVAFVTQPDTLLLATAIGEALPCNNGMGDIDLTVTPGSGTPPYTFVWSNGPTSEDQSVLNAGTYTVTVTDFNGCTTTAQAIIDVVDIIPPMITCPADLPLGCNAVVPPADPSSVMSTDDCGAPIVSHGGDVTTTLNCVETTIRTYIATDVNGLTSSCVQTITRTVDLTPPSITCPAPIAVPGCNGAVPIPDPTSVTASDGCGGVTISFVSDVPNLVNCVETTTRTYMATDACGNTNTCTQLITRTVDVTSPVLSGLPGPTTIECSATPMWTTPTVTDGCGVPVLSSMDVTTSGSCPDAFTITRTWTATDPCGNTATASQVINVTDTTPPVISALPAPSTIECTGVPSWTTPTATDNCSMPVPSFNDVTTSGPCPDSYTITRTWTATDECSNTTTAVQVINVVDSTPPVISPLPGATTIECSGTPTWTTPTVTDNCGTPMLTSADVTTNGSCPNEYSITRTWTATDECGNTSTATQTINVDDTVPPVITPLPGPTTIECSVMPSWTTPMATDNCATPTLTFVDVTTNGSCPNEFSITRTWTANDGCGNTATASQTINVDDTMPPVISGLPTPTTIECSVVPSWTTPTATDNCGMPSLGFVDVTTNGSCPNEFSITRTWTATDLCGNTAVATQTINVDDTTPPVISGLPGATTIECSATPSFATPTATDNCGAPSLLFNDVTVNGSCPNEYSITRTWTATDLCGNTAVATQTINVDDTVPPVISALPGVTTIECSGSPSFTTPTATDNCGMPSLTFMDVTTNGSCPTEFSITRTWTATDLCGNVTVATQTINVDDTMPPVISALPGTTTIECSGTPSFATPTATDNCGMPSLIFMDVTTNGSCPNEFSITRTWTATDLCGNTAVATQTINVDDTVAPIISGLPGPTTIECSAIPSWTTPTATDNCGMPTLSSADVTTNGPCPGSYSITRTWTADDGCGNTATASQTINVDDTMPPVISGLPGPTTIECSVAPSWATPTVTDNCGTPTLNFVDVTTNGSCPNEFSITRTWTADDGCGNTATASQTISVDDTMSPVISGLPSPTTIECSGTPSWTTPTVTDNCGAPMLSSSDVTTNGSCPNEYSITRTWTATDLCGNTSTATQTINIDDTMPPVLSALPGPTTIECSGMPSWTTPTATDNCGVPTLTSADVTMALSCPSSYSITRTWTATDLCGNTATVSQTINVDDTMPPVISGLPGATTIECSGTPSWTTPTATDNCGTAVLTFADVTTNGTCPNEYSITRTWTATDDCGNTATATQTINVDDTMPPVISGLPGPSSMECSGTPSWTTPTVTDNCGTPTVTSADVTTNGACPNEYTITRTWTADDGCGNTATASQIINVDDTTPPVISGLPGPSSMECSGVPSWTTPTVTDNCGTPTLTFADVTTNGSCPNEYTITRTWTADDGCGNTATATQTINVDDTTSPVISGLPGPTTIECSGAPSWTTPTATDNCAVPTLSFNDVTTNGSCPNEYSITRTWTADDGCGNTATASQTINVDDTMSPVISGLPGPTTIECSGVPSWTTPTATDNCDVPVLNFADVTMTLSCAGSYSITRTWTATDDCGNTATASQTINVDDTMPPVISGLPGVTTIECSGTPSWTTPTATDNCGMPVLTFADVTTNGTCANEYSITRTWTATDDCGNTAIATQTINVDDTMPPVISGLPGPSSIECSGTPSWATPTATDNCAVPTLNFADVTTNGACPNEYTITRTWTADDGCGNTATASQVINVEDTTPPVISGLPGPSAIECSGTPSWTTPTATDNCGVPTLNFADVTTNGSCPNEYTVTRTWTADDGCGNTATAAQIFNVDDTTPPVISGLPGPSAIECSATPSWTTPTVTDNCGVPTLNFADVTTNGSCPNEYSITRTWTADDGCGNTATATQTINVDDTTPPVISGLPGASTIECSGTPAWATPTATDNCGVPVLTFADVTTNGTCPNEYSIMRTWTATDDCGNTATASQTINVDDTMPPVISGLPGPSTIECSGTPSWATPTATDNCGTPVLTFADVTTNGTCPSEYSITRTWTADDGCGNTATATQTINVDDTVPPVISGLPGVTTIECGGTPSFDVPTATDNCGVPTLSFADVTTNGACPGDFSVTRTWTADDGCGNTATASQTINVEDTTPPVISGLPGVTTIECGGTPSFDVPTATDNCGIPTLSFADVTTNGACPGEYSITRTWTADDGCGNTATASQTINVEDTTPPVISGLPGPSNIECSGSPSWTTPTVTDNCGTPTLNFVDVTVNGSCPNEYSITRTWTADDGCGNTATAAQTINVDDTTPPVISGLPGPSTIECSGTPSWATPTATDNCGVPTLSFADVTTNGSCPNEYSITRTWTADDGCGNTATASQTINVDDTIPPVISGLPGPSTIECSGTPTWTTPTATDNCGVPTLNFADVTTNGSCPNEYSITRTWTADDGCGNTATASQIFNVDDTTPPVISGLPGVTTIECGGTPSFDVPTATDNCGVPTLNFADVTTNGSCPGEYSITRTWTADDGCGNTATAAQTINVEDTTPPIISGLPGVTTIECGGTPSFDVPTATDNCGVPTLNFADVTTNGSCPGEYSITRTWTADDGCGNTATAAQTINVEDNTPPVISGLPGPSTIECSGTPSWTTPTATDNCGTPTLNFVDVTVNGTCPNEYSITRTWTADDGCGNTAIASQTISVDDTTPPVISGLPVPTTIECSGTPSWTTPTATDNCGTPTLTFADVTTNGSCPNEYSITRTWTADDGCGNTGTATQTINVDDTVPPVISGLPAPTTIECVGSPSWTTPTATDNCGVPTLTFADVTTNGSCPGEYSITRTWTADDGCGNTATASQTINVEDTTPPVISGLPGVTTIECDGTPTFDMPTATDNCGVPALTFADVTTNGSCPSEYSITRTWTADDGCGNTATASQTINVDDTTPPVISGLPGVTTIECDGTPSFDVPTATDNCGVPTLNFADVTTNGSCPNEYSITRTWTADDGCGNTATASQTINVEDTTPPVISGLPGPSTIECSGTPTWATPTATDNCSVPVLTFADVTTNGACPNEYSITRTWTATDDCGNVATATQVFNVDDTTPPTASDPAPVSVECVGDVPVVDVNVVIDEADNCPGVVTVAFVSETTTGGPCPEVITRTYSVTDPCGNQILVTQTITINDITPPTASSPAPVTVDCIADVPAADINDITDEADNCPAAIVVAFVGDVSDGATCPETITRTYSVTDACGNVTLVTQTITVDDDVFPTASNPGPLTVDCIGDVPVPDVNLITDEADNCPGTITVAFVDDVSDGGLCPETITRTFSVTDACGNQILVTQTITVDDDVLPTASSPAPLTVDCIGDIPAPDVNEVTDEADNCSGALTVDFVLDASDGGTCPETITRTYSVTDACGNSILVNQIITVDDDILPTASGPAPVSVDCVGDVPAPDVNAVIDEADNCPGAITVAFVDDVSSGGPCPEIITRTYSVTDACGNQTLVTQLITINDITPPTASSPPPVTVDCIADVPAADINDITDEADNCPAAIVVAFVGDVSDGATCPETITRTYSVTDACGNVTLVTQSIVVDDDVFPTASNLAPLTADCIGDVPVPDINLVTDEADNCPGAITVAFAGDVSDGGSCPETITRSYSVTDACGNQILVTQTITVDDTILPTASNPGPLAADCSGSIPLPDVNVITDEADNCPAPITVAFVSDVSDGGSCPETVTRTYSVTDACGNEIMVTQTITVGDVTDPTASNPAPINVECIGDVPAPDVNVVTDEADNCAGLLTVAFVNDVSSGGPCPEVITRTYSVTDACGNQIMVTQTITINDITPPTASNPAPVAVDCIGDVPVADVSVVTDETDNCIAPVVVAFVSDVPDGASCPLTITRTYSITDACGNQNLVTQTIAVNDIVPPTATNPSPIIVSGCNTAVPAPDISYVTDAADNCSPPVVSFVSDVTDLVGCTETTTRTFSVTDACNNSITVEQLITRTVDNTPPVFTNPPADLSVDCIAQVPAMAPLDYTDNCSPGGTIVGVETGPSGDPLTITREWTVTDDCGNVATETQTITVLQSNLDVNIVEELCPGEMITIYGEVYSIPGIYLDTLPGVLGECDTLVTIEIIAIPLNFLDIAASYCFGDSVFIYGVWYSAPNIYLDTVPSTTGGCDTALTITIAEIPLIQNTVTESYCFGDSVQVNGIWYSSPNTYFDTIPSLTGGCDTALTLTITEDPLIQNSVSASYCFGDSVQVNGIWYSAPNTYFDTIPSLTGGCDTALTLTITEDPLIQSSVSASYCFGDSVQVNGIWYSAPNTYFDTIPSLTGGCDTALTLTITEDPLIQSSVSASYCFGDSVQVNGIWYSSPSTYFDTIPSLTGGCDTALTLTITEDPLISEIIDASFCTGGSVFVNGIEYDMPGVYQDTILSTTGGCDTAIVINIAEQGLLLNDVNVSFCEGSSVVVYGIEYDMPGTYQDTVPSTTGGCDTAVTIFVTELNLLTNDVSASFCSGSSVFIYGVEYDMPGTYQDTVPSTTGGCDTAVTVLIIEEDLILDTISYLGCEGDGYSVTINGNVYDESTPMGSETLSGQGSCDTLLTIDLQFAPFMPADITTAGPFCTEAGIQTLMASPSGGTWSGAVSSDQFDPALLGPGTHEVIYTTPAGPCQSADTIDIVVYELVISCLTIQDETAPMANDGQGQVTVSGGIPDYTVSWTGAVSGSVVLMADGDFIITSLPPDVYTIEVTDATGCTATCQFTIESAIPCDLSIDDIIIQDATCSGVDNGAVTILLSGTMTPFEYSLDGGAPVNTNVFTMLAAGPHSIVVTDAAGCMDVQNFLVGAGPGPSLAEDNIDNASCGECNGSITVVVNGGAPPYNYSLDGIMYGLSPLFPGLCAGTYDIYLIDDGGCTDTITLIVAETDAPMIIDTVIGGSSCGQSDGSITINATGGLDPLMYSIDGGVNFQLSPVFNGHPAGIYPIVVRDAAGCETTGTATITDIGAPVIVDVITTPTSCGTFDGTITINASGGTPPLMYSITGGAPFQSSNFFEFLPAGNYDIAVRDANGCLAIDMVTVNTTNGPVITTVLVTHTNCGNEDGVIEIIATGGTGDLLYSIDGGGNFQSSNIFDMLADGDYDIMVVDESNCPVTDQVTINDSEAPRLDVYYTLAHCGRPDGQLEVEGDMGVPPYMYSINGGNFGVVNVFVGLISDFYTLAVKDANDCIFEIDVLLEDDDLPEITDVTTTDPPCGMTNGSIEIVATGDGLQYSILTPAVYQPSPIFDPVPLGNYTINVRDQYGCFAVATAAVINPMPNPAFTTVVVDSECGMNSGSIQINATLGTMPYTYSIGGLFVATSFFDNLAANTYTVTVRDNNNCEISQDVVIISVGTQTGVLDTSICDGAVIIIDGNIFNTAGIYNVPISGGASNGCDSTLTLTLGIDPLLEKEFQDSICVGEVYTYNGTDYTLPGQYVVDTITAAIGCDTILILDLLVNPLDTTYIDTFICTGGVFTIGGIDYTMTGEYPIDTIPAVIGCDSIRILRLVVNDLNELTVSEEICEGETFTINGMDYTMTGLYTIDTLAGPGGCDTILFLDLVVNPLPTANAGADLTLDCDVLTVTLNGSATGGSPLWTGPDINPGNETQLMPEVSLPGTYILTVTSADGCIAIDSVIVNLDPESVIANAGIDDFLSCDVLQITLQGSPLGPDYTYQWTGPGIDATNENLPNPTITEGGTYTLVVTNTVTQCVSAPDEVFIDDISAILIAIIQDPISFNCYIDSIDLDAIGSSTGPNIVYAWFDTEGNLIANTPGLEITSGGMFTLIVEDTISGCFDDDTVMVEDLTQYPQVDAGLPQSIDCDTPTALLNEGATNNNDDVVFQWTSTLGGIVGPDTLITAVVNLPGQYYYLMATDTTNGCQNQDSVFVTDMTELPLADINIAEIITCIDETALLDIGNSSSGTGMMYVWSGPDLNNIVSETLETSVPGQYYLDVINEATGCASRDTALLLAPMEPQDLMATIDIPVCEGDPSGTITIDSVTGGTPVYMYSINGGAPQTSPTFEDLYAGVYSIAVVDANGCVYAESYTVAEGIQLTIDIGPDIDLELGDSIILWADVSLPWSQIDSIVWTPIDILSCTYCINPVLYGLQSDVVTATVYSGGCIDQDMLNVRVDVDANIYIPNVFSPNDDGINDHVTVFTDHRVRRIVYLEIFDRWGNQVFAGEDFEPNDPLKGWDGSFKGKVMNPAVFAYIARVELINGDHVDRKGDITIVR